MILDEAAYIPRIAGRWSFALPWLTSAAMPFSSARPCGYNHFHEWYEQAETEPDWQTFSYNTIEGGNVPEEEVELARRTLDERTFRRSSLASFETFSGRVFPEFDESNVADDVADVGGPILVGLDFNVGIMAGVICSKVQDQLHIWDEIAVKNSNTDEVGQMLRERFPHREIIVIQTPQVRPGRLQQQV